ncbi:hypothetical protein CDD81_3714 [Ophiocordyceps australis]|uniref:Uncharacterized protein n=1 Tax=Ophiocordyceps australis TaxID=1399860 RepID=A0A2C5XVK2_9HYPO|nr:hypothetical protein CDD81_3714 [Ophiocordyceps australis]
MPAQVFGKKLDIEANLKELNDQQQRPTICQRRLERMRKVAMENIAHYDANFADEIAAQKAARLAQEASNEVQWRKLDVEANLRELEAQKKRPTIAQRRAVKLQREAAQELGWIAPQENQANEASKICRHEIRPTNAVSLIPGLEAVISTGNLDRPFWFKFDRLHSGRYNRLYHLNPLAAASMT